jgi:ketosteroid isomerase-like protein
MVWRRVRRLTVIMVLLVLALSACSKNMTSDEEQIKQLLSAESHGVVSEDIDGLMSLWTEDAVVRDANHTPDNPSDDVVWEGKDAIRERYVKVVFPGNPSIVEHPTISIEIKGNTAVVTTTTKIGNEIAPSGDRWTFKKIKGKWFISSLTYNLEGR